MFAVERSRDEKDGGLRRRAGHFEFFLMKFMEASGVRVVYLCRPPHW